MIDQFKELDEINNLNQYTPNNIHYNIDELVMDSQIDNSKY